MAEVDAVGISHDEFSRRYVESFHFVERVIAKLSKADRATVEDIVQAAWARAWEKRAMFRGDSEFVTWVCTIARNEYFTRGRRRRSLPEEALAIEEHRQQAVVVMHPLRTVEFDRFLAALPTYQRSIILEWARGDEVAEIGNRRGLCESTIKVQIFRAKNFLRMFAERKMKHHTIEVVVRKRKRSNRSHMKSLDVFSRKPSAKSPITVDGQVN